MRVTGLVVALALLARGAMARLDAQETAALREAAWAVNGTAFEHSGDAAILREAGIADPSLTTEQRQRLAEALVHDAAVRAHVGELLRVRLRWRSRPGTHLACWWDPRQRGPDGLPSRAPTRGELEELERIAENAAASFALPPPFRAPYRIDLDALAPRVFGPEDLRWGVVTASVVDRAAVVELVLRRLGDLPWLVRALALLHGECADRPACRASLLADATRVVVEAGYVDVADGLRAGHLASVEDPALASAVLAVDHLERRVSLVALAGLVAALTPDDAPRVLKARFARWLGETTRQVDRAVLREVAATVSRQREEERLGAAAAAAAAGDPSGPSR